MIDLAQESLVSLSEAAKFLPRRREGKRPNVATLYRWTTGGCKGIVLESLQCGGTRCTSKEALQRFFERLTEQASTPTVTPKSRSRSIATAERELEKAGI